MPALAVLVMIASTGPALAKPRLSVRMDPKSSRTVVQVSGVPAARVLRALSAPGADERLFFLALEPPKGRAAIPMVARAAIAAPETVELLASTSLTPGASYLATFSGPEIDPSLPRLVLRFRVPERKGVTNAKVAAIYPTQNQVPANLLKFYVRFSVPMSEGQAFAHVRLLDAEGKPISQAFRERELWTENHQRLTLWINPGRTKQALGLSESLGPVLMPNREYTLEIGPHLKDQRGLPLGKLTRKRFRTGAADQAKPRITEWKLSLPTAKSRSPLTVAFPEPLDRALVERVLTVLRAGAVVRGRRIVSADCRSWRFVPEAEWKAGDYHLVAAGELEDLAGNSLYRAFETHSGNLPTTSPPTFQRVFKLK